MKNKIEEQTEMDSNDFTVEVMPMFCTLNGFRRTLNFASFEDGLLFKSLGLVMSVQMYAHKAAFIVTSI